MFRLSIESVIMTVRYLSGLPTHIRSGRVLMHNNVLHGPNWTSGLNGFRYWTESQPPDGFVLRPCGWAGRKHYADRDHVNGYRADSASYRRRVVELERHIPPELKPSGPHQWPKDRPSPDAVDR